MADPPRDEAALESASFAQSCSYCGAQFEVAVLRKRGSNQAQDYACPECRKSYAVRATAPPNIRLLSHRSDGKADRYQETMF